MCSKLFLVTRADLPHGQQAIQSAHALREFSEHHPEIDREWYRTSNTLIMKAVPNEAALHDLMDRARKRGIHFSSFREPDRNDELTAIAFEPRGKALVQGLPLALMGAA
jgi:tRNA G37 N-methylase TrmD